MATRDELMQEATEWRKHLYVPGSMVYSIINATAEPKSLVETFDPAKVVERYYADRESRVKEHVDVLRGSLKE